MKRIYFSRVPKLNERSFEEKKVPRDETSRFVGVYTGTPVFKESVGSRKIKLDSDVLTYSMNTICESVLESFIIEKLHGGQYQEGYAHELEQNDLFDIVDLIRDEENVVITQSILLTLLNMFDFKNNHLLYKIQ